MGSASSRSSRRSRTCGLSWKAAMPRFSLTPTPPVLISSESQAAGADAATEFPTLSKAQLRRYVRIRLPQHPFDDSGVAATGVAIYSLSDPRNVRGTLYVGQTSAPRQRLLQ